MPVSSLVLGVDLVPIKPIRGARTFVSDITSAQCRQLIKREAAGSMFDVVVHDGAPNVGGAWTSEAYTQVGLRVQRGGGGGCGYRAVGGAPIGMVGSKVVAAGWQQWTSIAALGLLIVWSLVCRGTE
jgi:hypothetical protein